MGWLGAVLVKQRNALVAILAEVDAATDVYPVVVACGVVALPDELVVGEGFEVFKPLLAEFYGWEVNVTRFAGHVLRVAYAAYGFVQCW